MNVDVRVLGSPSVWVHEEQVSLHGRPLMLLARLALSLPAPVPMRRLVEDLWPDGSGTDGALRVNLTRVRKAIGEEHVVRVDECM